MLPELPADFSFLHSAEVSRLVVGLSGGVDSVVLLDAALRASDKPLVALHINHHLHDRADETAGFCHSLAARYQIGCHVIDVEVSESGSMETNARAARYAAFETFLTAGDVLLLAHHADDQVETALFRLFRGSRAFGLEAMPVSRPLGRGSLYRPLLSARRGDVISYAKSQELNWVEDPTNQSVTQDRNFIRHQLLPLIDARFPGARAALLAGVSRDRHVRHQLQDLWLSRLEAYRPENDALDLAGLEHLPAGELIDLLTAWMLDLDVRQPTGGFLVELSDKIRNAHPVNETFGEFTLHSFNGRLYLGRRLPGELPDNAVFGDHLTVPGGHISNEKNQGRGLRSGQKYDIRYRSGGEKLTIRHNRSLKNLFQEQAVPPWLRGRVPLIYAGDELVAMAGLPGWGVPMLVADGWRAEAGEPGVEISLHLADRIV